MPDTAIFDVDGTLVDTNYHHALSWYRAFRRFDIVRPLWRLHRGIGMGGDHFVEEIAGEQAEREHGDELREAQTEEFDELIGEVQPFEGARELLEDVKRRGFHLVLASSGKCKHVEAFVRPPDAESLADAWTTSDDADKRKPDPDLVQSALDRVKGAGGVMIGDSVWDVEAGKRAGVPCLAVRTGGFGVDELTDAEAIESLSLSSTCGKRWTECRSADPTEGDRAAAYDCSTAGHLSSPRTRWHALLLDELLEALQVTRSLMLGQAQLVSSLFHQAVRLGVQLQGHPRFVGSQLVERDHAGMLRAFGGPPRNPLVRDLLGDFGIEFSRHASDRDLPVSVTVIDLTDLFHAVHEVRKGLELRPLAVRSTHGDVDVEALGDVVHVGHELFVPGSARGPCIETAETSAWMFGPTFWLADHGTRTISKAWPRRSASTKGNSDAPS